MPNSDDRVYGEDVGYADMAEAPRRQRESNIKNVAIATSTTLGVLVLAAILIRGSLPAMTPEEIVQREDYQGQQPARHIFNLYSLKQDKLRREPKQQQQLEAKTDHLQAATSGNSDPTLAPVDATTADTGVAVGDQAELSASESTPQVVVVSGQLVSGATDQTEVPVVVRAYEKSELRRDTALPVVSSVVSNNSPVLANKSDSGSRVVTVLPVYTIKADQTNLRTQPSLDATVIKTLSKGQTITVFDNSGRWVQVATNDGQGTTGYIHNSLMEIADID